MSWNTITMENNLYELSAFLNYTQSDGEKIINGSFSRALEYEKIDTQSEYEQITVHFTDYEQNTGNNYVTILQPFDLRFIANNLDMSNVEKGCFYVNDADTRVTIDDAGYRGENCIKSVIYNWSPFGYIYKNKQGTIVNYTGGFLKPVVNVQKQNVQGQTWTSQLSFENGFGQDNFIGRSVGTLKSTAKIFKNLQGARLWLIGDDESGEVDPIGGKGTSERNINTLYYEAKIYRSATSTRTNPTLIETHKWEFDVQRYNDDGTEINKWNRGVFGFVNDAWCTGTSHYNLDFIKNTTTNNLINIRLDGVAQNKTTFFTSSTQGGVGGSGRTTYTENVTETIQSGTFYYYAKVNTNMFIFDTFNHAKNVIDGLTNTLDGLVKKFVGDSIDPMTLQNNELNFDTDMSDTFILDNDDVKALATRFNAYVSADGTIISDLFVGLAMHQNPIDCSIDLFSMPIDLTDFVDVESYTVKFSPTVSNSEETN